MTNYEKITLFFITITWMNLNLVLIKNSSDEKSVLYMFRLIMMSTAAFIVLR